jgi:hypothetical protein
MDKVNSSIGLYRHACDEIFKQSMVARNRAERGLLYRYAWPHRLLKLIPWKRFLRFLKVRALATWLVGPYDNPMPELTLSPSQGSKNSNSAIGRPWSLDALYGGRLGINTSTFQFFTQKVLIIFSPLKLCTFRSSNPWVPDPEMVRIRVETKAIHNTEKV